MPHSFGGREWARGAPDVRDGGREKRESKVGKKEWSRTRLSFFHHCVTTRASPPPISNAPRTHCVCGALHLCLNLTLWARVRLSWMRPPPAGRAPSSPSPASLPLAMRRLLVAAAAAAGRAGRGAVGPASTTTSPRSLASRAATPAAPSAPPPATKNTAPADSSPPRRRGRDPAAGLPATGTTRLVIVESPAKAKKIAGYLGPGATVLATYGHVRDLPAKAGSVSPEAGFAMAWESAPRAKAAVAAIAEAATRASEVVLATDPDREGEAISWHILEELKVKTKKGGGGAEKKKKACAQPLSDP